MSRRQSRNPETTISLIFLSSYTVREYPKYLIYCLMNYLLDLPLRNNIRGETESSYLGSQWKLHLCVLCCQFVWQFYVMLRINWERQGRVGYQEFIEWLFGGRDQALENQEHIWLSISAQNCYQSGHNAFCLIPVSITILFQHEIKYKSNFNGILSATLILHSPVSTLKLFCFKLTLSP